jgi:hypothetical protein
MRGARGFGRIRVLAAALAALFLLALSPTLAAAAVDPAYLGAFGPDGTEATSFERLGAVAVDEGTGVIYVGDWKKQVLYKFDSEGHPLNWGGTSPYIKGNEISGLSFFVGELGNAGSGNNEAAVDPETHVLYVTSDNKVRAFEANGEPHEFTAGPGAETSEIPGATELKGVAVDSNGTIYATDSKFVPVELGGNIHTTRIYSRSGALLTEFDPEEEEEAPRPPIFPNNAVAVAPDGSLYTTSLLSGSFRLEPSQFPVTASTTYSPGSRFTNAYSISVALDPTTSDVYVGRSVVSHSEDSHVVVFDEDDNPVGTLGAPGEAGDFAGNPWSIAINGASERLYAVDERATTNSGQVKVFETFTFPVIAPTVTATSVIDLNLFTATLRAKINPNTLETTYHFEYGTEDCSLGTCTSVGGGTIPAGHKPVAVTPQEITGLQPGTTYHYRVVAKNAEGETKGPDRTFTTPRSGLGFSLADQRAWEMVSPANKFGGKIVQYDQGVMQAAANGNGLAYESVTSIEPNPDGSRAIDTSTVLARRAGAGGSWASKDVTPPQTEASPLRFGGVYKTFSTNLERALLEQQDSTPLSIEASEETPYLRENTEPGTYRPLVTGKEGYANVPPGTKFGGGGGSAASPVRIVAADPALTHPVVKSKASLVPEAEAESLYRWDEGHLAPVSELPASEGGAIVRGLAGSNGGSVHNAVSADGSRVFWSTGGYVAGGRILDALYARDTAGETTGRLDVVAGGSGEGRSLPVFNGASVDGSVVFFTDSRRLTADASPPDSVGENTFDLYRCEVGPVEGATLGCTSLADISAPISGTAEKAEVLGIAPGQSEDGTRAYFFARGVLDTAPNEAGDSAVAGEPNLYLWEEGQGTRFIATISERDRADWGGFASSPDGIGIEAKLSASASPSGRYLAFMSDSSLTGYDNRDAKSDEAVEEIFRYDATADRLDCVSCNPSGASPEGKLSNPTGGVSVRADNHGNWSQRWVAAILPVAQESEAEGIALYRPRVVHDNGRVFFNAIDSLVSADANGEWDVYQYEPTGVGDCTSTSEGAAIARSAGGCVSLLSSGTAEEEATFVDASETGDDVFFFTPARLSVTDEDFELDVYDARTNGIPATLPVINECLGEACQAAPNPPNDPTPNSASFQGAGNVPSERCAENKRKVTREGSSRCVAKKHKHKKKRSHKAKAKRANNNRRAGR